MTGLKPPKHLSAEARGLWRRIIDAYDVKDESRVHLLTLALEQHDRMREAQRAISEHGVITRDRYGGQRQNPAVAIENRAHRTFVATLKAALKGQKPVSDAAKTAKSANVTLLHEFLDNRRAK